MIDLLERGIGLELLDPRWLWAALLLPVSLWWAHRRRPAPLPGVGRFVAGLPRTPRSSLRAVPLLLQASGLLLLVLAGARPAAREPLPIETRGIDIVLCLDVSSSMEASDMDAKRTRLAVARDAAAAFIGERPTDRIGILTFARYADLRCPPTSDHEALLRILADSTTVPPDSPEDATGIGGAVARAAAVLADSPSPSRVVILLTDGEENVAIRGRREEIPPSHAAQLCRRFGVRVYAIAAGTGRVDASGTRTAIDTKPVEALARRTGGSFHRARSAGDVVSVYEQIDRLEPAPLEAPRYVYAERHRGFLAWGMALLALGALLSVFGLGVLP